MNPKIILFDIETFPLISMNWGIYDQNALKVVRPWEIASFAYKELNSKEVFCIKRSDFKDSTDKTVVKKLYQLFKSADILIAHNGDAFDIKKSKARFIKYNLKPLAPITSIDTKKLAKRSFNFTSNSLNDLGEYLGLGKKVQTGGFSLWDECMKNNPKSWALMEKYNKQDVVLLEKVYLKLRSWSIVPDLNLWKLGNNDNLNGNCPRCGNKTLRSKGLRRLKTGTHRLLICQTCAGYARHRLSEREKVTNVPVS